MSIYIAIKVLSIYQLYNHPGTIDLMIGMHSSKHNINKKYCKFKNSGWKDGSAVKFLGDLPENHSSVQRTHTG